MSKKVPLRTNRGRSPSSVLPTLGEEAGESPGGPLVDTGKFSGQPGDVVLAKWHWYDPKDPSFSGKTLDVQDPDLPDDLTLIQIGNLIQLRYRPVAGKRIVYLQVWDETESHLAFDRDHKHHRMYFILSRAFQKKAKEKLFDPSKPSYDLNQLAKIVGGIHGIADYPTGVKGQLLGVFTHVIYTTTKRIDGKSNYIHQLAEEGGCHPWLVVDSIGRIWIVGGDYTCPTPGITN